MPESEIGIWQQPALPLSVMFCFCLLHCGFQGRKNPWSTPHLESSRKLGKSHVGIGGVLGICTGAGSNVG